jgi:hypothetical protein
MFHQSHIFRSNDHSEVYSQFGIQEAGANELNRAAIEMEVQHNISELYMQLKVMEGLVIQEDVSKRELWRRYVI